MLDTQLQYKKRGVANIGACVLTLYGTGVLKDYRPFDGMHVVALAKLVPTTITSRHQQDMAYLQQSAILRTLRACVGDSVDTPYGVGVLVRYRMHDDMYQVAMDWSIGSGSNDSGGSSSSSGTVGNVGKSRAPVMAYVRAKDVTRSRVKSGLLRYNANCVIS
jgi:hypothetical protein